ncbi:MAG: hypothetical protein IT443_09250 [Phycisphaeraceae bacterium]|nr:hypothetical protein [Phycisphaeraceae bacterium]
MFASLSNFLSLASVADGYLRPTGVCIAVAALAFCAAGCAPRPTNVQREEGRVRIDDVPNAKGEGNGYIRGLETLLAHAGTPTSYERLMGLSGLAFILQVDTEDRWEGKVDAGWWPLDPWGLKLHRDFLSRAVGYELKEVGSFYDSDKWPKSKDDIRDSYRKLIHPDVVRQIDAGRPVLVTFCPSDADFGFVITGYDRDTAADRPPVWGRCAVDTQGKYGYSADWPFGVIMVGKRLDPMDPNQADLTALRQAVALAHDQAGPTEPRWHQRRFTGQKAYAAWAALLRNVEEPIEDMHHANVRRSLLDNRRAAVAYLRSVAEHRKGQAAEELRAAAAAYQKVLEQVKLFDPAGVSNNAEKRRQLADHVDHLAKLEQAAITHVERALDALK